MIRGPSSSSASSSVRPRVDGSDGSPTDSERQIARDRVERALVGATPEYVVECLARSPSTSELRRALATAGGVAVPRTYGRDQIERLAALAPATPFFVEVDSSEEAALSLPLNVFQRVGLAPQSGSEPDRVEFPPTLGHGVYAISVRAPSLFASPATYSFGPRLRHVEIRLGDANGVAGFTESFFPALEKCSLERLVLSGNFYLPDLLAFTPPKTLRRFSVISEAFETLGLQGDSNLARALNGSQVRELTTNVPQLIPFPPELERLTICGPSRAGRHLGSLALRWSTLSKLRSLTLDDVAIFASRNALVPFPSGLESMTVRRSELHPDTVRALQRAIAGGDKRRAGGEDERRTWRSLTLDVQSAPLIEAAARYARVETLTIPVQAPLPSIFRCASLDLDLDSVGRTAWPWAQVVLERSPELRALRLSTRTSPESPFEEAADALLIDVGEGSDRLESLDFSGRVLTNSDLAALLPKFPNLRRLELGGTRLEGELTALPWSSAANLEHLGVSRSQVTGRVADLIASLPTTLTHLDVRATWMVGSHAQTSGRDIAIQIGGAPPRRPEPAGISFPGGCRYEGPELLGV